MSSLPAALQAASNPRARRALLDSFALRCAALALGCTALMPVVNLPLKLAMGEPVDSPSLLHDFAEYLVIGCAALISALAADRFLRHRVGPLWRVALAIVAAAALATAAMQLVDLLLWRPLGLEQLMAQKGYAYSGPAQRIANQFLGALHWSILLVVLFELVEASRRAHDELYAVRMAALATERELVEGGLRAMQARVDPDLLFDTLLEVDRAYAAGVAAGQAQLDALIRFLRAALPGDGGGASSVEREQELVAAYVELLRHRGAGHLELDLAVDPRLQRAPMPAMLLLPLVRWALGGRATRAARIALHGTPDSLSAVVEGDADDAAAPSQDEIASLRERLRLLYAQGAELSVSVAGGLRRAALRIPLPASAR